MNWDYIAGFFDGEGCVSIQRAGKRDSKEHGNAAHLISISQSGLTGLRVLSDMADFLRSYDIHVGFRLDQKAGMHHRKKDSYCIRICKRDSVIIFLEHMLPRVHVKKVAVQDHLRYMRLYPSLQRVRSYSAEWKNNRVDNVELKREKACVVCHASFRDESAYPRTKTCSRSCAGKLMWKQRRGIVAVSDQPIN
jgi:hypothetical protein